MPIRDIAAMNANLDNAYGATKGPNSPASLQVALFMGDPMTDGVEVPATTDTEAGTVANGYARVVIANDGTTWLPAADGEKVTVAPVAFPDVLAEWPDSVTHWALFDAADGVTMWDCAPLVEELEITSAGPSPTASLTVFYSNNLDEV